jgi:uncharacterized protein (DUF427 family)
MALTVGTGPFGKQSRGVFNFDRDQDHVLYFEDSPRRVRAAFAGETVFDTRRAKLLHETGHLPVYYIPLEDVREDLLSPTDHRTTCPVKGQASYWSVRVGDRAAENAAWSYPEPLAGAPPLGGHVAFFWEKLDAWFEEDEQILVHPRDPYHRVDVLDSSRNVRVRIDDELVADSGRPKLLFETGLPTRYYLPRDDVRTDLLVPSGTVTRCPYKGLASYWSVARTDGGAADVVWSYAAPLDGATKIAGLLCFFNERVDLEVDGEPQERPRTAWS